MSRTIRKRKHTHKNSLKKQYVSLHGKTRNSLCGLGCCGDAFGIHKCKGAKRKRRRYIRHLRNYEYDIKWDIKALLEYIG
jgi:hypothetical protein